MKSGSSGLKLKSSQQLVPSLSERVARINQEFYDSMEGQESIKDESHRSKCSKQEMQWLSISWNHGKKSKRRQPRELKHKIKEANGHKLDCKPEHKANNRDQDKTSDSFRHFNFKAYILQDQPFLASAGVWWWHSAHLRCFTMPIHGNSGVFTTSDQDQD